MCSGTLGSETTSSSIRGQQRIQGMMCFPVGQHWLFGEPGSGSSAKVNPSPMCSLLTCRSPWLRESVRIHGMEFLDLCGVLGRYAHLSVARDISTACPYNSGKNNVPQEIVIMKSPLTHHSYTFHDIFYEFVVSPCFPPCFDLFSFHISQTPKFQALVKGRMTGAGSCWPCQGTRKPRKGTTQCLSTWQTKPSFGDEKTTLCNQKRPVPFYKNMAT